MLPRLPRRSSRPACVARPLPGLAARNAAEQLVVFDWRLDGSARRFRLAAAERAARGPSRQLGPFERFWQRRRRIRPGEPRRVGTERVRPGPSQQLEHRLLVGRQSVGGLLGILLTRSHDLAGEHPQNQRRSVARAPGERDGLPVRNADRAAAFRALCLGGAGTHGTLPALSFSQWPLPDGLRCRHAALRRLSALVDWMAAQLTGDASSAARTALNNLVSATVIASAYGDPDEAVSGTVVSTGGIPRPGLPIRITLNRASHRFDLQPARRQPEHRRHFARAGSRRLRHDATVVTSFAATAPNTDWTVASQAAVRPGSRHEPGRAR